MKVSTFSKITGIPATKIRFYSKQGILHSKRCDDNNYRELDEQDALDLYCIQSLRSYDVPLSMIASADVPSLPEEWANERIKQLEDEIRAAEQKLERLKILNEDTKYYRNNLGTILETCGPASYNFWNLGAGTEVTPQMEEAFRVLADAFPYSYIAIRVLLDEQKTPTVQIGLGILQTYADKCGYAFGKEAFYEGKTVYSYAFQTKDPMHITKQELSILLAKMEEADIACPCELIGRFYGIRQTEEGSEYCIVIGCSAQ